MDHDEALKKLVGNDEARAREALDHLHRQFAPQLERFVRYRLCAQEADAQDVVQQVFEKIWCRRLRLEFVVAARWFRFLQVVATNVLRDRRRAERAVLSLDEEHGPIGADPANLAVEALRHASRLGLVKRMADTLWLGLDPGESEDERNQRLLAAQLYYLRGASFDQTLRLALGGGDRSDYAESRRLECWLADSATIRLLASRYLTLPPERVAAMVICPSAPPDSAGLNRLTKKAMSLNDADMAAPAVGGLTWGEAKAILLRYRFGKTPRPTALPNSGDSSRSSLEPISVRLSERLPFVFRMNRLLDCLERAPAPDIAILRSTGIWKRLIFECSYLYELPQKEIVVWLQPAAQAAGYHGVTESNVNTLISARRLMKELSAACCWAFGGERDE
jgi:DNA-directed RNA polymerase specialized sigma24 family protein